MTDRRRARISTRRTRPTPWDRSTAAAEPVSRGFFRPFRPSGAVVPLLAATVLSAAPFAAAGDYADRIRPFVEAHCLRCHSTKEKKGGLDIERFATIGQVRAEVELWETVLEMIEDDEMPPEGRPRPPAEDRRRVIAWIRDLLEDEARRRAGDPGPAMVRRLNNAEYRYAAGARGESRGLSPGLDGVSRLTP